VDLVRGNKMTLNDVLSQAGVVLEAPRSLTYDEYSRAMKIAVPHGPDESCTCDGEGCSCAGAEYGCTCDIDWDLARDIRDLWYT